MYRKSRILAKGEKRLLCTDRRKVIKIVLDFFHSYISPYQTYAISNVSLLCSIQLVHLSMELRHHFRSIGIIIHRIQGIESITTDLKLEIDNM